MPPIKNQPPELVKMKTNLHKKQAFMDRKTPDSAEKNVRQNFYQRSMNLIDNHNSDGENKKTVKKNRKSINKNVFNLPQVAHNGSNQSKMNNLNQSMDGSTRM